MSPSPPKKKKKTLKKILVGTPPVKFEEDKKVGEKNIEKERKINKSIHKSFIGRKQTGKT